ncbi:hypothetical protein GY21_02630 [Cryobacterium roopkundense]|nr:hypothetical protein GY21_02630 [Cryobacterium roopkundense]
MRRAALLCLITFATSLIAVSAPLQAPAASAMTPATTEAVEPAPEATPSADPVAAPTLDSPSPGIFIGKSTTTVSGTRDASSEVQLLSPSGGDPLCIIAPDGSTTWSCSNARLPNSSAVTLRVVVSGNPTLFDEITVAVLGAPTVTGGPTGQGSSNGLVRGTGYPGASVTASVANGISCTSQADGSGAWACHLDGLESSGNREVTASQLTGYSSPSSSNSSAGVMISFDLDRPDAPVITSPGRGAQIPVAGTTYTGTGESGATVTVFAGPYSVCSAPVTNGAWSCSAGGVAAGSYSLVAVQQDVAGNVSAGSAAVTVTYVQPSTPSPSQSTPPTAGGSATTDPTASSEPSASATADAVPPVAVPGPTASASSEPPSASGFGAGPWNYPTRFTTAVTSPWASASFPWLQAVLLALGAVVLLAIPSRLLAGTISRARGGRPLWGATSIAGRNRARDEFETAPTVQWNRWLLGGAALVAAATLVMLSGPVISQPAYLRLLLAVVVALLLVNLAAALVPLLWSSRVMHIDATITFLPRYLVLVAVAAIGSRVLDIHPALLFGLLGSVTVAAGPTLAQRGQLASVRAASLVMLAIVGWFGLGLLPPATGFLTAFFAEVANTVVLAAIGSAVLVLVPIGRTSGRSVLAWSPPVWAGLMVVSFTLLFAVLSPVIEVWQSAGTVPLLWVAAGVFAALSAGAWAWQRFVAPAGL